MSLRERLKNRERVKKRAGAVLVGRFGRMFRALGENAQLHQWLAKGGDFPIFDNRFTMYEHLVTQIGKSTPIDFLEFGVFRGASLFKWAQLNTATDSRFIGFDSFEGLPEDWTTWHVKGTFSTGGVVPKTDDRRIQFIKGLFSDTLRPFVAAFEPRSQLVIHNDSDLYSSTLFVLATIDPFVSPGTVLIFDEFSNLLHEWKAFHDYMTGFGHSCKILAASGHYFNQMAVRVSK